MPRAFVLINVESGSEDEVLNELKTLEGVEEAYFSYGVYDLITKIRADSMDKLKELVTRKIRTLSKVRSTLTLIMMEEQLAIFSQTNFFTVFLSKISNTFFTFEA